MKPKPVDKAKVSQAVVLAQQISELKRRLKLLEKGMSLKEFIAYVDGTRPRPESETTERKRQSPDTSPYMGRPHSGTRNPA